MYDMLSLLRDALRYIHILCVPYYILFDFQDAMYPLMSNIREHLVSHHVAVSFQLIFGVLG